MWSKYYCVFSHQQNDTTEGYLEVVKYAVNRKYNIGSKILYHIVDIAQIG